MERPKMLMPDSTPNESIIKIPTMNSTRATPMVAFFRSIFHSSTAYPTMASIMQIVEVRQAKKRSRKNTVAKMAPPFICAKIVGSVMKTSGGPMLPSMP